MDEKIEPPQPSPKGRYGAVPVAAKLSIMSPKGRCDLGKRYEDVSGGTLPTFEELRQRSGLVLYETTLNETEGILVLNKPRDLVFVFVDGVSRHI